MYHITDLKKFNRCPRSYYYSLGDNSSFNHYLRSDESLILLLARFLKIEDYFRGTVGDTNGAFFDEIDKYEWFIKTRFECDGLRIKVPIMHKAEGGFDLYFVHNMTSIKDFDYTYYCLTLEVLRKLDINVNKIYLAYINKDYVFEDNLNIEELFILTDEFNGNKFLDIFSDRIYDFKSIINRIEATSLDSYSPKKSRVCHSHNICPYYYECFREEKNLPDDSILTLVSSANKNKMYQAGIEFLKDIDLDQFEGNRVQYAQVMASKNGGKYVQKYALADWLKHLGARPITFIDFEWDTYLIPQFNGLRPLDVLPFEFVLYILDENNNLSKYSFLGKGDCRREFAEGLLKYIPKSGPIVAYNAYGAECRRIKELANYFPEYRDELLNINERFVDLATPFLEGLIYDVRMRGNFTLKQLVSIVSDLNYKSLEINDGMKAVFNWRNIDLGVEEDDDKVKKELIEYCGLDAYGLYLVYEWLLQQIK